jgi:WD40 repeat protein
MTATTVPTFQGAQVFGEPRLHTDGDLLALAFAPDGTLWSVEEPGVVRQWEPASGRLMLWQALSDMETLWSISPDARSLASASNDVAVWDALRGTLWAVLPQTTWITALAFHPLKGMLAVGDDEGAVSLWNIAGAKRLRTLGPRPADNGSPEEPAGLQAVSAAAFSADGKRLAVAGEDKVIHLWDTDSGDWVGALRGHTDRIPSLAWHPDGRFLVSVGWDRSARVWDATTLEPVILLNSHGLQVTGLAFSADGRLLATADSENAVHVWDFAAKKELQVLKGAHRDVQYLAFSPDGTRLAFGGGDRCIHVWDPVQGQRLSTGEATDAAHVSLALSADGKRLAVSGGGDVQIWETDPIRPAARLPESEAVRSLAYSPVNPWVAGGSQDGTVRLWNAETGERHALWQGPEGEPLTSLAFAADGTTLASASSSGLSVWLWNVADGEPVLLIPDALDGCTVETLAFHPAGRLLAVGGIDWLATGGTNGAVSLWDVVDRCEVATFFGGSACVAFDPSGERLASASLEETVYVWDVAKQTLLAELPRHDGNVTSVAFSPDGTWLATAAEDRMLRLWDSSLREPRVVRELDTLAKVLRFSPDGRWLYTGNGNTTCYRFEVERLLREG